ncbi:MAG TPA: four helix bundle protein [Thermoanaerobaculia bacterium]|nr:four helix bundle protein [Thermoanaerobaculia bacterium]
MSRDSGLGTRNSDRSTMQDRRLFHEELDVYRVSKDLAIELFRETRSFPRSEQFGLTSQVRRAATSIPANIAEGAARRSKKEFVQFLGNARGSAAELRVLIEIAAETDIMPPERSRTYKATVDRLSSMLSGLIRRNRANQGPPESRVPSPESRP